MGKSNTSFTRAVVGGGLFGCYAAIVLANKGHDVLLLEQESALLTRASFVNQARLHTGFHYPRSIITAKEALRNYERFRKRFPAAVRDFEQIYAISEYNSRTTGEDFSKFVKGLGSSYEEVDPEKWFFPGKVSRAFRVEEPSFDSAVLRQYIEAELTAHPKITVKLNTAVIGGTADTTGIQLIHGDKSCTEAEGVVLATYAGTNSLRRSINLSPLPLTFELAEVILGHVQPDLVNLGFTVMDGPFWSLMPFGHTDLVTLTSVGLTPLLKSELDAEFGCQSRRTGCTGLNLQSCTECPVRPVTAVQHQFQQMSMFLKNASSFEPDRSIFTVKTVLSSSEVDDSRPTLIHRESNVNLVTVLSGKVSTLFDLDSELT